MVEPKSWLRTKTDIVVIPSVGYARTDGPSILGDDDGNSARLGLDIGPRFHTALIKDYNTVGVYDQAVTAGFAFDNSAKVNLMWRGWNQVHMIGAVAYGAGVEYDVGIGNSDDVLANIGIPLEVGFLTAIPGMVFVALSGYVKPSLDGHVEGGVKFNVPLGSD